MYYIICHNFLEPFEVAKSIENAIMINSLFPQKNLPSAWRFHLSEQAVFSL